MTVSTRLVYLIAMSGFTCLTRPAAAQSASTQTQQPAPSVAAPVSTTTQANVVVQPTQPSPSAQQPVATAQPVPPPGYVLVPVAVGTTVPAPSDAEPPPDELPYEPGQPVPAGYHVEERVRKGLVIGGGITLGVSWLFSATAAVSSDYDDKSGFLMIPVLGPWLMLAAGGAKDKTCTEPEYPYNYDDDCGSRAGVRGLLFFDGITQAAGTVMLATGLFATRQRLIRNNLTVAFAPTRVGVDGYGVGAVGHF